MLLWAVACLADVSTLAQQVVDLTYDTRVARPAFAKDGPRVLIDEAHRNFHTAGGRYKPFADLISNDGFRVGSSTSAFSAAALKDTQILVIANASGQPPAASAFTEAECDAVRDWVRSGGALLLIADHAPYGSAASALAQRFGVDMSGTSTIDEQNYYAPFGNRGFIVYTRDSGRIADHAITNGRDASERISRVMTFTGQSLKGPAGSVAFLQLADSARDRVAGSETETTSAAGRAQGIAFSFGQGRVVVLGEAAMISAQTVGANRQPMGMNQPGTDNRQLALNVVRWLSGAAFGPLTVDVIGREAFVKNKRATGRARDLGDIEGPGE
jgi:hypothetical protein